MKPRRSRPSFRALIRQGPYLLAVALPMAVVVALGLAKPPLLADLGNMIFDTYQRAQPRAWDPQTPVRIVEIDDESLAKTGQWPWPRSKIASLVKQLGDLGAVTVVLDIVLSEPDASSPEQIIRSLPQTSGRALLEDEIKSIPSNDAQLADTIAKTRTVLGAILTQEKGPVDFPTRYGIATAGDDPLLFLPRFKSAVAPLPSLSAASAGIGAINWLPDRDQVVRRVPLLLALENKIVASLSAETLRVAQGASTIIVRSSNASGQEGFGAHTGVNAVKIGDLEISTSAQSELRIYFTPTEPRRFIPAWKVLQGAGDLSELRGRIVIVGASAGGLSDQRATPIDASVSGVEIQAQSLENMIAGIWLSRPDWAAPVELLLAIATALIIASLLPHLSAVAAAIGTLLMLVILGLGSWAAFSAYRMLLDPTLPFLSISLTYVFGAARLYQMEQHQKRHVREAFGRYVSPDIVARLADDPSKLVLGGETRMLTVMFCDVRGFTTLSERYKVERLTQFMNEYFTPLTDAILANRGTVDKYIGDALMAFWNAPHDVAEHARYAARASLAMVEELNTLNERWRSQAEAQGEAHHEVKFGIGLATGECCVGNLGSIRRFDYSVLGDTVNIASRLEGTTKSYHVDIIASETTRDLAPDFAWLEIDSVRVKGKTQHTRIFYLAGDDSEARSPAFVELTELHERMLQAYRMGEFTSAASLAREGRAIASPRHRGLYEFYEQQCHKLEKPN